MKLDFTKNQDTGNRFAQSDEKIFCFKCSRIIEEGMEAYFCLECHKIICRKCTHFHEEGESKRILFELQKLKEN